ncbi:hypothetical protein TL16_g07435 [Triparma laevis f. inornata]|uniref:Alpha-ketoglutarate-dependent dioxygenase FTO catalytic domain-containing protein n=2 Tax=Triparma laevis TaxID=1534972 RepID=A0A9W7FR00_9STRA|nr:hypothetical protein TL16_g07435 [Triparma laevis f. inornata]GMI16406.1 hypothetical protein TrLO_g12297 [Triparma laevis f. longispina]
MEDKSFVAITNMYYKNALITESGGVLNDQFLSSFTSLLNTGGFLTPDIVLAGKRESAGWSKTFVERTLVGDAGGTYKYLGLRIYAHPWNDDISSVTTLESKVKILIGYTGTDAQYSDNILSQFRKIHQANETIKAKSHQHQTQLNLDLPPSHRGSNSYSLTLINRMLPSSIKKDLKTDAQTSGKNESKTSVSWHTDSGLQDYSTIAVWHHHEKVSSSSNPWRISLRPIPSLNSTPPIPAIIMNLESGGGLYYIFDEMNLRFEHAVLSGREGVRWSSTHRVTKEGGKYEDILGECWRGKKEWASSY